MHRVRRDLTYMLVSWNASTGDYVDPDDNKGDKSEKYILNALMYFLSNVDAVSLTRRICFG